MIYDFETLVSRKNTGSGKWDEMTKEHPNLPENVAPLSVADMELKNPPEIVEGLKKYIDTHILGYTGPTEEYFDAVCGWMKRRNDWDIKKEEIVSTHGVVTALAVSVLAYTDPGDGVTSDMLKLAIAATQSSTICDITCQPLAIVYDEEGGVHSWDNGNILLTDTTIPYEVYGFKTGFTDEAGFCFIGYAGMNDKKIITLTYGCEVENRFADTKKLMDLGFDIYDENHDYYSVAEY